MGRGASRVLLCTVSALALACARQHGTRDSVDAAGGTGEDGGMGGAVQEARGASSGNAGMADATHGEAGARLTEGDAGTGGAPDATTSAGASALGGAESASGGAKSASGGAESASGGTAPALGGAESAGAAGQGTAGVGTAPGAACAPTVSTRVVWSFPTFAVAAAPAFGPDGTVYTLSRPAGFGSVSLAALDPIRGSVRWTSEATGFAATPAVGTDGSIYTPLNGSVVALDPADGHVVWTSPDLDISQTPAIGPDGTLYAASGIGATGSSSSVRGGSAYALNPEDGSVLWATAVTDVVQTPLIGQDGRLYAAFTASGAVVGSSRGGVYALSPADGSVEWTFAQEVGAMSAAAVGVDGTLYAICNNDANLYVLNPADGSILNTHSLSLMALSAPPNPKVDASSTVYWALGSLYATDPDDGSELWTFAGGRADPAFGADGTLYATSSDAVSALDPAGGTVIWTYSMRPTSPPVVGPDAKVYVTDAYTLYALSASRDVVDVACTPCSIGCSSASQVGQCLSDGSGYAAGEVCASNQECRQGACVDCVPEAQRGCSGDAVYWHDSCGRIGALIETCGLDQVCQSGECINDRIVCDCQCACSYCTADVTSSCEASSSGCSSCVEICLETCTGDSDCGSYVSASGSCG
jgi:outer membrane protein assembly factor BamB